MVKEKQLKLILEDYGQFLGMEKGCYVVKDKDGIVKKYPQWENEIGEVILKSGCYVSVGVLANLSFWEIDTVILTRRGKPIAYLKNIEDDSHIETRINQYKALENGKGIEIAKQIVLGKIKGQTQVLKKYGLRLYAYPTRITETNFKDLKTARKKLTLIESHYTKGYFKQIFNLIPEPLRPENRKTFSAYDGINNIFNLAYETLKWKVCRAIIKAKLEPYLGFLHSEQFGKPSLLCDLTEIFRYYIDDYLIQFCQKLKKTDFTTKIENYSTKRMAKREYLNNEKTRQLMKGINDLWEQKVEIKRVEGHGEKTTVETWINETAILLAKYIRNEKSSWQPQIALLN